MREQLALLREMGVKSAAWTEDGALLSVEFWPPVVDFGGAAETLPPAGDPIEPAVLQAVNILRGARRGDT